MDLITTKFLSSLLLPPLSIILPLLLGLWWRNRRPRAATFLFATATLLLTALTLPLTADWLCRQLETDLPLREAELQSGSAEAIVVLAGGWRRAPEYDDDATVNQRSLERLTHGVWLHRYTGLPIALSGGRVYGSEEFAEATLMERVLRHTFGIDAVWIETGSRNTEENARYTASMLRNDGIAHVLLVTHAFHMNRAKLAFERSGLSVTPAPMGYLASTTAGLGSRQLIPSASSLGRSYFALHELLGQAWYRLKASIR